MGKEHWQCFSLALFYPHFERLVDDFWFMVMLFNIWY
jgi:hypothetical protein